MHDNSGIDGLRNFVGNGRRARRVCALLAAALLASGCGMSNLTSGLGGGMFGGSSKSTEVTSVTKEDLLSAAKADFQTASVPQPINVAHGCPRFMVWTRDDHVTVYEQGRVGDNLAVVHRGEITKTARECAVAPGRVSVKYGFSGRVLMGPKGHAGRITLPVQVFVMDAKRERIASEKMSIDVDLSLEKPIGYFSQVRTVTFNIPEGTRPGEYEVYVGFEQNVPGAG